MHSISQQYAVKQEKLALRNQLGINDSLAVGQELMLRGKKKGTGLLISKPKINLEQNKKEDEFQIDYNMNE